MGNKRRKKDMARRTLIAKMRKHALEMEEERENAFSPMKEYKKWCEPINSKLRARKAKEQKLSKGSKDIMMRSVTQDIVHGSAPTWKMGERNDRTGVHRGTPSPGPKYSLSNYTQPSAPAVSMGGKLELGGFLDAVGGVKPRSNPNAIGLDTTDWSNSKALDRANASARHHGTGKTFGVRHSHLNVKPKNGPAPNEYAATEAFYETIPTRQQKTISSKSKSLADLQLDEQMGFPGPAQYSPAKARSKMAFKDPPKYSMAAKLKNPDEISANPTITPGPDTYGVPNNSFSSTKGHAPLHSFGYHKRGKTIIHAGDSKNKRGPRKKKATGDAGAKPADARPNTAA